MYVNSTHNLHSAATTLLRELAKSTEPCFVARLSKNAHRLVGEGTAVVCSLCGCWTYIL